jgi:hypothetical protein
MASAPDIRQKVILFPYGSPPEYETLGDRSRATRSASTSVAVCVPDAIRSMMVFNSSELIITQCLAEAIRTLDSLLQCNFRCLKPHFQNVNQPLLRHDDSTLIVLISIR